MSEKTNQHGFTLVELLVGMAVTLIVVAAFVSAFAVQSKHFTRQSEAVEIQEDVRGGIQVMAAELMMAGYNPVEIEGTGILSADAGIVQFAMDLNGNGTLNVSGVDVAENITYDLSENTLRRKSGAGTPQPMAENIQSVSFRYFDADGNELTTLPLDEANRDNVRRILVTLTAVSRNSLQMRTLSTDIRPRNLGLKGFGP